MKGQRDLGALPYFTMHTYCSADSLNPRHYGVTEAAPIVGNGVLVEALPTITNEDFNDLFVSVAFGYLEKHRDPIAARVLGRVHHGFASRLQQRVGTSVGRAVADLHHVDLHVVVLFNLLGHGFQCLGQDCSCLSRFRVGATEQPGPQFTFLTPGERDHFTGMIGLLLNDCQRLQN